MLTEFVSSALGQNFSKMFDITVEDPDNKGEKIFVWQNSWYIPPLSAPSKDWKLMNTAGVYPHV